MVWMFVFPRNSYVENLTSKVMVLGGGAFGGDYLVGVEPPWMD